MLPKNFKLSCSKSIEFLNVIFDRYKELLSTILFKLCKILVHLNSFYLIMPCDILANNPKYNPGFLAPKKLIVIKELFSETQ